LLSTAKDIRLLYSGNISARYIDGGGRGRGRVLIESEIGGWASEKEEEREKNVQVVVVVVVGLRSEKMSGKCVCV